MNENIDKGPALSCGATKSTHLYKKTPTNTAPQLWKGAYCGSCSQVKAFRGPAFEFVLEYLQRYFALA